MEPSQPPAVTLATFDRRVRQALRGSGVKLAQGLRP
jgi:hypothetical protein